MKVYTESGGTAPPRRYMEMHDQFNDPTALLSGKELPISRGYEAMWDPGPI
jgi:hypothetical protein